MQDKPKPPPFEKYRAEFEAVDVDRWAEMFSARTRAAVETEAEAAAAAAYDAVRRLAERVHGGGKVHETAETVRTEIERAIAEIVAGYREQEEES